MINLVILEIVKSEKYHYFGKLEKLKISKIKIAKNKLLYKIPKIS